VTEAEVPASLPALALLRRDLPQRPPLTREQEEALVRRFRGEDVVVPPPGDPRPSSAKACERLIEQTLPLVISVARGYAGRNVPMDDLVQEGALCLRRAVETFEPDRGTSLGTYAMWWIRKAMLTAIAQVRHPVHLPDRVIAEVSELRRTEEALCARSGTIPTVAAMAEAMGTSVKRIEELRLLTQRPVSFDGNPSDEDNNSLHDAVLDDAPTPEAETERADVCRLVRQALDALPPQERQVMTLRFGIDADRVHSPQEVAGIVGVPRSRAERIELQALSRLRSSNLIRRYLFDLR
jgi:RNA polymerase nonessential primary-like sigma factor